MVKKNISAKKRKKSGASSFYTVGDMLRLVHQCCPPELAYDWDNVGLLVGNPAARVERVMIALEADDRVIATTAQRHCELLITHHPLIFRPLKTLRSDDPATRRLLRLSSRGIALIAAHTNFDRSSCSMNRYIAKELELANTSAFEPFLLLRDRPADAATYKFVVFTPRDYQADIIEAIDRGGGAAQGAYSHATFSTPGIGTFTPKRGAHPFIGKIGHMTSVSEIRVEAFVPAAAVANVICEVKKVHPYEEPAWDIYKLAAAPPDFTTPENAINTGLGVMGTLPKELTMQKLGEKIARVCKVTYPPMITGKPDTPVRTVAVMGGSGGSMLGTLLARRPDVFITGEFGYHEALAANEHGINIIALGHANSERLFSIALHDALIAKNPNLAKSKRPHVKLLVDDECTDPFNPLK